MTTLLIPALATAAVSAESSHSTTIAMTKDETHLINLNQLSRRHCVRGGDTPFSILRRITVGTEPRGCVLTPTGKALYVANHTSGTVSIIDTAKREALRTVTGFNRLPYQCIGGNTWFICGL